MATRYPKDRGLSARMGLTMFLIGLLYVAFIAALIAFTKIGIGFIIVIAAVMLFAQYYFSDKIALFSMGAREVTPDQEPVLHGVVDRLCALADMRKPRVAVADTDVPNAFATGRDPGHAVVCATTGLMRRLNEQELEAVLSHELSHVAHRDVAVMTLASFLGVVAGMLTRFAFYFGLMFGDEDNQGYGAMMEIAVFLVSILVYIISFLLTRALSRYRELSADRSGAILIGRPSTLAAALVKVSGEMSRIPTRDLRQAEPLNAFFFTPALRGGVSVSNLFSTHPTLEKRLEQLARLEAEMGKPA